MSINQTRGEKTYQVFNYIMLSFLGIVTLYPFYYTIIQSLTDPQQLVYLFPRRLYYANYYLVFNTDGIWWAYLVTLARVSIAVPLMLIVSGAAAFSLTRKELSGRKIIIVYFFITMFISGGLIPSYMVLRMLRLVNTFWVYVFPAAFSVWTMIVMKTSFQTLPEGLVEAALIDGASYWQIFVSIVMPLSIPLLATLGLFSAVGHWNDWFTGLFYVHDDRLRPLQSFLRLVTTRVSGFLAYRKAEDLRQLVLQGTTETSMELLVQMKRLSQASLDAAYTVVSLVPILILYPWLQKYFVKGVLIGSIKE